jgi:hypothetical protein
MPRINGIWMDEEEMQKKLIRMCGGLERTEQLQRIWNRSYPTGGKDKATVFEEKAKAEGYSEDTVNFFIIC